MSRQPGPLTKVQEQILRSQDTKNPVILTEAELAMVQGFHFCPDWDYMPICIDSPEYEACACNDHNLDEW